MVAYREDPAFVKATKNYRVTVTYDPAEIMHVYVCLPHIRDYLKVPLTEAYQPVLSGLMHWHYKALRKFMRDRAIKAQNAEQIAEARAEMAEFLRAVSGRVSARKRPPTRAAHASEAEVVRPASSGSPAAPTESTSVPRGGNLHVAADEADDDLDLYAGFLDDEE